MQNQMDAEMDPQQREARIQRQQQFMKWRLGGKEEECVDEEFKQMEVEEAKNSWKKSGWRDWKAPEQASMKEQVDWNKAGWTDFKAQKKEEKSNYHDFAQRDTKISTGWKERSSSWQDWKEEPKKERPATKEDPANFMADMMKHMQSGTVPDMSHLSPAMQQQFAMGQMLFAQAAKAGGVNPVTMMQQMMVGAVGGAAAPVAGEAAGAPSGNVPASGENETCNDAAEEKGGGSKGSKGKGEGKGKDEGKDKPDYRPAKSEAVPGITDKRWEGSIKAWFDDKGFGFIESPDLKKIYPDTDVFLHEGQRKEFKKGAWVTFDVFMNNRGKPQATDLQKFRFTTKKTEAKTEEKTEATTEEKTEEKTEESN